MVRPAPLVMLLCALGGCGGDDAPADAATDGGLFDATMPSRADIPWLDEGRPPVAAPVFTPCPSGWVEVESDGVTVCAPHPGEAPEVCAADHEVHLPGEPGCRRVGSACPADALPMDVPADAIFVLSSAPGGGDGSRASPFASLAEASVASLSSGTTVAIGVGTYTAGLLVPPGVTLAGACAEGTRLRFVTGTAQATLTVQGGGVVVRDVTLDASGARRGMLVSGAAASVTLDSVIVEGAVASGILVTNDATLTGTDLVIRDTDDFMGDFGRGLSVENGGDATVHGGELAGNAEAGAVAVGRSASRPARLRLEDVLIRDTRQNGGDLGRGLSAENGGRIETARVHVLRCPEVGARSSGLGSEVVLEDTVIERSGSSGLFGQFGRLSLSRVRVMESIGCGVELREAETVVEGTDVTIADTAPGDLSLGGAMGGACIYAGRLALERAVLVRSVGHGIFVQGESSHALLTDVRITTTTGIEGEAPVNGRALMVQLAATLEAERVVVEDAREGGVMVGFDATDVTLTDVAVIEVQTNADGRFGYGVSVVGASTIRGARVLVDRASGLGVYASEEGLIELEDAVIRQTRPQVCPGCPFFDSAMGVGAYTRGRVSLTGFSIASSGLCGAQVAVAGELDLRNGEVRGHDIGACIQIDGYPLARISDDVAYYDNGTNLEVTMLPVPDAVGLGTL